MKNRIIDLIPSISLKEAIRRDKSNLDDYTLFKIGYIYSKGLSERLEICNYFLANSKDEKLKEQITHIVNHLLNGIEEFKKHDENTVYVTRIIEDTFEEHTYFSRTYDEALEKLHAAYLCDFYDNGIDASELDFGITKRGLYPISDPRWADDLIDFLWFNEDFEITNLYFYHTGYDLLTDEEQTLIDDREWISNPFPTFFNDGDLVKYRDRFGMVRYNQSKYKEAIAYVVWLDNCYIDEDIYERNSEGFYDVLEMHEHVPFCDMTVITKDELPKEIKAKYEKLSEFYTWFNKRMRGK